MRNTKTGLVSGYNELMGANNIKRIIFNRPMKNGRENAKKKSVTKEKVQAHFVTSKTIYKFVRHVYQAKQKRQTRSQCCTIAFSHNTVLYYFHANVLIIFQSLEIT